MTDEAMSPLRRRMIEDMAIRKLARKTQQDFQGKDGTSITSAQPSQAPSRGQIPIA